MSQVLVEEIIIPTTREKFFFEYITLKKPVLDAILSKINKRKVILTDIPLKIYAHLLYSNDTNRHLSNNNKWNIVFSRDTKQTICDMLDLKEHQLNNYFSILRKIRILNGRTINKPFIIYSSETQLLSFKFRINGNE